jgi:hypothetical protein
MSLENATVLGLTLPDDERGIAPMLEQLREMTACGQRLIVVVSASPMRHQESVNAANRLPVSADAFQIAREMVRSDLEASERLVSILQEGGLRATRLAPEEHGPLTRGGALDAEPRVIDASVINASLEESEIVVFTGGVGRDFDGRLTSMGAEGGALSAVFLGDRLALPVRVRLAPGEDALPRKAALFARRQGVRVALAGSSGVELGWFDPASDAPLSTLSAGAQLRVSLLGLGSVGRGVLHELLSAPDRYRVVGVALTSADARHAPSLSPEIASFDVDEILTRDADVVINLVDRDDPCFDLSIERARMRGVNIVSGVGSLSGMQSEAKPSPALRFEQRETRSRAWRADARRVSH